MPEAAAKRAEQRIRTLTIGIWLGVLVALVGLLLVIYWKGFSPAPKIAILHSEVHSLDGSGTVLHRPGIFEVRRVTESDATATGRIAALFERRPPDRPVRLPDGREVVPDRMQFQLAEAAEYVEKGRHMRTRVWEVPRLLPPGEYIYRSIVTFCNPMRCDEVALPEIPVTLSERGWPPFGSDR